MRYVDCVWLSLFGLLGGFLGCADFRAVGSALPLSSLTEVHSRANEAFVPELRGVNRLQVLHRLEEAGLGSVNWQEEECGRDVPTGCVCRTVPPPGGPVAVGTAIWVYVQAAVSSSLRQR